MKKQTKKKQDVRQWEEEFRSTDDHKALLSEYLKNAGAFVPVRKAFVKLWGLPCAMVLGDLLGWEGYLRKTHAIREDQIQFYRHLSDQSEETGLTRHILRKAAEQLQSLRLLDCSIHEETHFRYFKLNHRRILWWAIRYEAGFRSKEKGISKHAKQAEGHQNFNEVSSKKVVKILTGGHQNLNDIFNEINEGDVNCLSDSDRVSDETRFQEPTSHISMKDRTLQKIHTKSPKSPPTESPTPPPIESMPLPLQAWYDLPLVAKPSAKTYDRCRRQIDKLKSGTFPTSFASLNETWRTQYNIPTAATAHEWSDKELVVMIEKLGVMLTDAAYWPENKEQWFKGLTFMDFVFCSRTARSWLLGLKYRGLSKLERKDTRPRSTYREPEGFQRSTTPWVMPKRDRDAHHTA